MLRSKCLWLSVPALLAGCGGDGAGSDDVPTRTLNLYAASGPTKTYSHVWVNVQRIMVTNGMTSDIVFNSIATGGLKLDLTTLHGKVGPQYLFLGNKEYPAGLFSSAEITVANTASVVSSKTGEKRTVKFAPENVPTVTWSLDLSKMKPAEPGTNLVLNFDLGHWSDAEGLAKAPKSKFLVLGDGGGMMDPHRHVSQTLTGGVQDLTGAGESRDFTLVTSTCSLEVRARTAKSTPEFAADAQVKVTGSYDPATGIFNADQLELPDLKPAPSSATGTTPITELTKKTAEANGKSSNVSSRPVTPPSAPSPIPSKQPASG